MELTNEDYAALRFRSMHGHTVLRGNHAGNLGDMKDFRSIHSREMEKRFHSSASGNVARQVSIWETISQRIEREQERGQHVCHVFEDDLRGMER